jgi:D-alanyl-lipoteichoic acid acyltransferase DltB (MBOAT superfamily)
MILQNPVTFLVVALLARLTIKSGKNFYALMSLISIAFIAYIDITSMPIIAAGMFILYKVRNGFQVNRAVFISILILIIYKSGGLNYLSQALGIGKFTAFLDGGKAGERGVPSGGSFYLLTLCLLAANTPPTRRLIESISTATFFPHILAGPILYKTFEVKRYLLRSGPGYAAITYCIGMYLLNSSEIIKIIFETEGIANETNGYIKSWVFYLYLFSNFFGYSLLATSYAMLFGIEIPINFNAPSLSNSPSDFWRRWHRSLSLLFRNNVFKFLKSRGTDPVIAVILVMVISGIWHGWALTYIVWGFLNGVLVVLFWKRLDKNHKKIATFLIMPATWIPFYCSNIESVIVDYKKFILLNVNNSSISLKFCVVLSSVFLISLIPYKSLLGGIFKITTCELDPYGTHRMKYLYTWREKIVSAIGGASLALVLSYSIGTSSDFVYQRF